MRRGLLSIIVPAYNEEENIYCAVEQIKKALKDFTDDYEVIFVDDGSTDGTWSEIVELHANNVNIRGIRFSKNFGKEAAIVAGLSEAKGSCGVVIDCDMQFSPEKITEMYAQWQNGYEVIEGKKAFRGKESKVKSIGARLFYRMISHALRLDMENTSDFKLLDRKAINAILAMPENNSFFRALSLWVGFKSTSVVVDVDERKSGVSKWSAKKLIRYALRNIAAFSTAPMQIITVLGVVTTLLAVVLGINSLIQKIMGVALAGFTTVILLQLFIGGVIMMSLGIIGFYIARIYEEVKRRPKYIISESLQNEDK